MRPKNQHVLQGRKKCELTSQQRKNCELTLQQRVWRGSKNDMHFEARQTNYVTYAISLKTQQQPMKPIDT
jgi:hypothetical protein